jgi:hypothetical protein
MSEPERISDDPLDRLLVVSLAARPEARPVPNLASRAVERARALDLLMDQQRRSLAIHRWRLRFIYTAAAMFIGLLIVLGGQRLLNEHQSMTSTDDSITSTESTTSNSGTYVAWLGGMLFIITLAGLATESAIAPARLSPGA